MVQKCSRIKVHNVMALTILLFESEIWTVRKRGKGGLTSIAIKFSIRTAVCTLFDSKGKEILEDFKAELVDEERGR
jgi:hypothetical protein